MDVTNEYGILLTGQDCLLGKVSERDGHKGLKNPRNLMFVQRGNDVGVRLIPMVGKPSFIAFPKGAVWYYCEDTALVDLYIKATTSIITNPTLGVVK